MKQGRPRYNSPMRAPLDTVLAPACRKRQRRFAWLAILAVCLQLLASGIASTHAVDALNTNGGIFAAEICHGTADTAPDDGERPAANGGHCPFCRIAQASIVLPPPAAPAFSPPEPVTRFFLAADASLQPSAPDSRHAPKRAPPFSFA